MRKSKNSKLKVFVGMSGGVDSSVAAYLLKKQNYNVVGVFLRCFNVDGCAEQDASDARRVAEKIGIPFYVWDMEEEYKKKVVDYMIEGYKQGITPNPDVMCNREIKFGLFLKKALEMGADYISTGHYARLIIDQSVIPGLTRDPVGVAKRNKNDLYSGFRLGGRKDKKNYVLATARDLNKDQTYFLWTLTQGDLKHCLFPIGDYLKSEVREIARRAGLPTAEKKDSQGICFLGKVSIDEFLSNYLPAKEGAVLDANGEKIGSHFGAHFYTVGQRHANIFYDPKKIRPDMKPRYVAGKDVRENTITVVEGENAAELYKKEIELSNINFTCPELAERVDPQHYDIIALPVRSLERRRANVIMLPVMARVRYRQPLVSAKFIIHNSKFIINFDHPVKFIAPGQSAVFYRVSDNPELAEGHEMLGGGVIQ